MSIMEESKKIDGNVTISLEDYELLCRSYEGHHMSDMEEVKGMIADKCKEINIYISSDKLVSLNVYQVSNLLRGFNYFLNLILSKIG